MSASVLIVFQSTDGHTATVAHHIAKALADRGVGAIVERSEDAPPPAGFDAVVLGDSIHIGRHSRELVEYARSHAGALAEIPAAVFQVSLTSAVTDDDATAKATEFLDRFCDDTGLEPQTVGLFAGALSYSRYRGLRRWLLREIAKDGGLDTDTSSDHVYTDWDAVDTFAEGVARLARHGVTADSGSGIGTLADLHIPQVDPMTTLDRVVDALVEHDTGVVLVRSDEVDPLCTSSAGGVVGIVSERDVIEAIHDGLDLSTTWAADVMSTGLVSIPGSSGIDDVAEAMVDHRIRHVAVPSPDGSVGIVSMRRIVGRLVDERGV